MIIPEFDNLEADDAHGFHVKEITQNNFIISTAPAQQGPDVFWDNELSVEPCIVLTLQSYSVAHLETFCIIISQ